MEMGEPPLTKPAGETHGYPLVTDVATIYIHCG